MKLLFDQNLSFKLVRALISAYPGSKHVRDIELASADDEAIWVLAGREGYTIVTKDSDFMHRALLRGCPPKVVQLSLGNCPISADCGSIGS